MKSAWNYLYSPNMAGIGRHITPHDIFESHWRPRYSGLTFRSDESIFDKSVY